MKNVPLSDAVGLIYPRLTVLVTTISSDGKPNAAPYSWIAPVSFSPAMLYLGIQRRETLTIKNIRATKEFVVNVVTSDWAEKAVACEAKLPDKVQRSGISLKESKKVKAPSVQEAKIVLECRLCDIIETGKADHFLVIGEIVHAEKDPKLRDEEIVMHHTGPNFISPGKKYHDLRERNKKLKKGNLLGDSMRKRVNFNAKRAPKWQVKTRVNNASAMVIKRVGGDIKGVNIGLVKEVAAKQNLPLNELVLHLRKLGANL